MMRTKKGMIPDILDEYGIILNQWIVEHVS